MLNKTAKDESKSNATLEAPSASPSPSLPQRKKNVIVCWDFDWSLINQNSDYYAQEKLYGADEYTTNIFPKLRETASAEGTVVFVDFMDKYGWPKIFNEFDLTSKSFDDLISDIPIFEENVKIVNTIYKHSKLNNDGKSTHNVNQYIISNSNQVLIDVILSKNKLNGTVFKTDQIFTNSGWYDDKSECYDVRDIITL